MNLLSYDEILRVISIGLIAGLNILVAYFLVAVPMDKHIKQLESRLND